MIRDVDSNVKILPPTTTQKTCYPFPCFLKPVCRTPRHGTGIPRNMAKKLSHWSNMIRLWGLQSRFMQQILLYEATKLLLFHQSLSWTLVLHPMIVDWISSQSLPEGDFTATNSTLLWGNGLTVSFPHLNASVHRGFPLNIQPDKIWKRNDFQRLPSISPCPSFLAPGAFQCSTRLAFPGWFLTVSCPGGSNG